MFTGRGSSPPEGGIIMGEIMDSLMNPDIITSETCVRIWARGAGCSGLASQLQEVYFTCTPAQETQVIERLCALVEADKRGGIAIMFYPAGTYQDIPWHLREGGFWLPFKQRGDTRICRQLEAWCAAYNKLARTVNGDMNVLRANKKEA